MKSSLGIRKTFSFISTFQLQSIKVEKEKQEARLRDFWGRLKMFLKAFLQILFEVFPPEFL